MKKILIILAILIVLAGIWLGLKFLINKSLKKPVVCTLEAKLCPDGSYVSRVPPRCEFAFCPETRKIKNSSFKNAYSKCNQSLILKKALTEEQIKNCYQKNIAHTGIGRKIINSLN